MRHSIDRPLAWPIVLKVVPPRTLDSVLDAVACLNDDSAFTGEEVDETIDLLIVASRNPDGMPLVTATSQLETLLRRRGLV